MTRMEFSEEQIVDNPKEVDAGAAAADPRREHGMWSATCLARKASFRRSLRSAPVDRAQKQQRPRRGSGGGVL